MMMKFSRRSVLTLASAMFATFVAGAAVAQDYASKDEAKALAEKAAAYVKANGKEQAAKAFMDPKGGFIDRDLYVVMIRLSDGERLAHVNPKLVGKSLAGYQDVDGRDYGNEVLEVATTKGTGWVEYKIADPVTKKILPKTTYIIRVDDVALAVGVFSK